MNRVFLLSAVAFTFFLCYIDEGYYDLRWMKDWGNWIAFALYVAVLFLAQKGIHYLLKQLFNSSKTVLSVVLGLGIGLTLLFALLG